MRQSWPLDAGEKSPKPTVVKVAHENQHESVKVQGRKGESGGLRRVSIIQKTALVTAKRMRAERRTDGLNQ